MPRWVNRLTVVFVVLVAIGSSTVHARDLTFEDRVRAQEAIERVYYAHQIGTTKPFEEAIPSFVLEAMVAKYLRQSLALEEFWKTPVTAEMLRRETERMTRDTRMPDRLRELFAALDHDAFLVEECLARPALVDRLTRNFFVEDQRIHDRTDVLGKRGWEDWWDEVELTFDENASRAVSNADLLRPAADCLPDDTWDNGSLDSDVPEPRSGHSTVWTGSLMIVWGGSDLNTGGRYDPATDSWTQVSMTGAPPGRQSHTAVWTGIRMVVWGGRGDGGNQNVYFDTGGIYDPAADSWIPTSTVNAPSGRYRHVAEWTGTRMVVWGGLASSSGPYLNTGSRYDPATDSWTATSTVNAPSARRVRNSVWTGDRILIWGGHDGAALDTGSRYDPVADNWTAITMVNAPSARTDHGTVWTGDRMVVWGGQGSSLLDTGGRYDPVADNWTPTSTVDAPTARLNPTAVWTGGLVVAWGGYDGAVSNTGSGYDPVADNWTPTSLVNAPAGRVNHTAVWTGNLMVVWGGEGSGALSTGARYDPLTNSWTSTSIGSAGSARAHHTAVWTGSFILIWGGHGQGDDPFYLSTGDRYDPVTDSWTPISTVNAPEARISHTAVLVGKHMVVWGGRRLDGTYPNTGGRYDSLADTWASMSTINEPAGRVSHTAVSVGDEMVVWGGKAENGSYYNTGGRYDPATDTWSSTSTVDGPSARQSHTAVWTGNRMVIWGGLGQDFLPLATGGRYDPATDDWTSPSTVNAPSARWTHASVWTGSEMVVWGGLGEGGLLFATGARYDPTLDYWTPMSTVGSSSARVFPNAVWTGREMVVWGGQAADGFPFDTGGRYDPASDGWAAMSTVNAPSARTGFTATWTGSLMVVWGGVSTGVLNNGRRYALDHSVDNDGDGLSECDGDCNDQNADVYPGRPEICDGLDNDCNAIIDDPVDTDGDGVLLCQDCDPVDAGAHAIPAEIAVVVFEQDRETLIWESAAPGAGVGTLHDVLRGSLSEFPVGSGGSGTCISSGIAGSTTTDSTMPALGTGRWYLVRGRNGCGVGTYGSTTAGTTRQSGVCP